MTMPQNNPKTVWSSEDGDLRKKDEKPAIVNSLPPQQQVVYLHRESKGRGGKGVTLIKGWCFPKGICPRWQRNNFVRARREI